MGINASEVKGGKKQTFVEQPSIEKGVYPARLVQVLDMGLQAKKGFDGSDETAYMIGFTFELTDVFMVDEKGEDILDKPRWVSCELPLRHIKADRAKTTLLAKALDPEMEYAGDFSKLISRPLMVSLTSNISKGKTYTNVVGFEAMRARDIAKCPELVNPSKVFDLSNPDLEVFNSLPEWIRERIKNNLEFTHSKLDKLLGGEGAVQRVEKKEETQAAVAEKAPVEIPDESDQDVPW